MRIGIPTTLLLLALVCPAVAGESRNIGGRVLDEDGKPVEGAAIDFFFWQGDESQRDQKGDTYNLGLGQLQPFRTARSDADGRFSIEMPHHFYSLMAVDAKRVRGGLATIPKGHDGAEVEIRLRPLVRLQGTIKGPKPGKLPAWASVGVMVPADPTRPLHMRRLVICGLDKDRFMISLPPGHYVLDAASGEPNGELAKEIVLTGDVPEIDLGVLTLLPARLTINDKVEQSQASGAMGDYTKRYGQKLPDWHITDARGVSKNVRLADFKGKWVLLDFWALTCKVCLKEDLPRLAKFYEEHRGQRDQFEILAICVDCDGRLRSIADVDRALEPIVEHVWGGKPLPFPVLLDPSMTTLECFGVPGYFTLLIDPDGRLVEGDEKVLAKKLKK